MADNAGLTLTVRVDDDGPAGMGFAEVASNGHASVTRRHGHIHLHRAHDLDVTAAFGAGEAHLAWPDDARKAIWIGAEGGAEPTSADWPWATDTRAVREGRLHFTIQAEPGVKRKYTLRVNREGREVEIDPDILNH